MTYNQAIELLMNLGFHEFGSNEWDFDPNIDLSFDDKLFTDAGGRNAIYVKISPRGDEIADIHYYYTVYVLEDVGCGAVELPFRWSYLDESWIRHLQNAFGNIKIK